MRDIVKNIRLPIDVTEMDFRLTKLDAFSGAELLRLLAKMPEAFGSGEMLADMFVSMAPEDLRSVMTSCLNHVEVLLPAGYQPIMQGSSWSWPELEHDTATCLKLTLEEALWTLRGFFGEGGPTFCPAEATSSPQPART